MSDVAMGDWWPLGRWALAAVLASYIGIGGLKKKSLNKSGAIAVRCGSLLPHTLTVLILHVAGFVMFDCHARGTPLV